MKHKAQLTISRPQGRQEGEYISITIKDVDAGIRFVDLEIELASFAQCLTGLSYIDCTVQVRDLENVGKKIERDNIEFQCASYTHVRGENLKELAQQAAPEGWIAAGYFGSQNSFFKKEGQYMAQCTIQRWVEKEEENV